MNIKSSICFYILVGGLVFSGISCINAQVNKGEKSLTETNEAAKKEDSISTSAKGISDAEKFAVEKMNFELTERDGKCFVSYKTAGKSAEIALEIPPPCNVVRDAADNARSFAYKDIESDVFMIVGDVKDMGGKPCGTKAQVVLLKKSSAAPGKTQEGTVCILYGTDEKNFWMLSH